MITLGISDFFRAEDGAVTVDWVVLTASVVALGMVVGAVIWNNSNNISHDVATYIGAQKIVSAFD